MKYLPLLTMLIYQVCSAQIGDQQKMLIGHEFGFYCSNNSDNSTILFKLNFDSNTIDSIRFIDRPAGTFNKHPIIWDLKDSLVFYLSLVNDGGGMPIPQLRVFNSNKIGNRIASKTSYDYFYSQETLKDNEVLPLYSYIKRIYYIEDTLKGPLFFDMIQKENSLFLYIYLQDKRMFEVWTFNHFPLIIQKLNIMEAKQILKQKAWSLQKRVQGEIHTSFQLVETDNKVHAIDYFGNIWDLSGLSAKKIGVIPVASKGGVIMVEKGSPGVRILKRRVTDMVKDIKKHIEKYSIAVKIN